MWAIGKTTPVMVTHTLISHSKSLTGHTTEVHAVCFDSAESSVVAGSSGGTIKLWDIDQQKGFDINC
jgi:katanin p80 WD40 repeat-containing subunit B1